MLSPNMFKMRMYFPILSINKEVDLMLVLGIGWNRAEG